MRGFVSLGDAMSLSEPYIDNPIQVTDATTTTEKYATRFMGLPCGTGSILGKYTRNATGNKVPC